MRDLIGCMCRAWTLYGTAVVVCASPGIWSLIAKLHLCQPSAAASASYTEASWDIRVTHVQATLASTPHGEYGLHAGPFTLKAHACYTPA